MGTSVESGTATAVVVTTGLQTYLGSMAHSITEERPQTSSDQGLNRFTWLMMQFMAVMVLLIFFINGFTKHDWKGAFFFALADHPRHSRQQDSLLPKPGKLGAVRTTLSIRMLTASTTRM